jgi:carbon monoxide dehydrogenase subunit G
LAWKVAMDGEADKAAVAADNSGPPAPAPPSGRVLRWLGIAIVGLVVAGLVVAFILPRHAVVTRSIEIAAPPSAVWPIVADLRRFNEWSPWVDLDPVAAYTFTGPTDGIGQTLNWQSEVQRVGSGAMTVDGLEPDSRVDIGVAFADAGTARSFILLEPAGSGTRATWGIDSDLGFNPIARYFGMMADGVDGPDYEKGLARLKALAEAPPPEAVADE